MGSLKLSDNFVGAATVGERGQVVIPAEARERLGINAGDKLLVFAHPSGLGVLFASLERMLEAQNDLTQVLRQIEQTPPPAPEVPVPGDKESV